jgi:hypothetical protein
MILQPPAAVTPFMLVVLHKHKDRGSVLGGQHNVLQ